MLMKHGTALERIDLSIRDLPERWYNVIPDLPRAPEMLMDPTSQEPLGATYLENLIPQALVAQEISPERWIRIPEAVYNAYKLWRPTPLYRAIALERHLETPAKIYFKYEGGSPTGSHKLNSALAQAYLAKLSGTRRLVADTGAGQWGCALALAGQMYGLEVEIFMIRSSYFQKPYRRLLMEMYGATVHPSPSTMTDYGRRALAENPDHPGSEGIAVSEALETVRRSSDSRYSMGAFSNHNLMHQSIIGLETKAQLASINVKPDYLIASVGCGSNMGGFAFPFLPDKLDGQDIEWLAAEPEACATLTKGEYRLDYSDSAGMGPMVKTYTLGHSFVPPELHAGGLRYHGCAPLIGLLRHEGLLGARAYSQESVFDAGRLFARLTGMIPAPETAHAIRASIEVAKECKRVGRAANIVFCYSGDGTLDLPAYAQMGTEGAVSAGSSPFFNNEP